jgi:hypothetical protein
MAAVEFELFTKLAGGRQVTLNELQKELGIEHVQMAYLYQHLHLLDCYK